LIYYLRPSWYVKTESLKQRLIDANQQINWYPNHIKEGRFGQWLENNVDWAISRERYWGTPIPIWIGDKTGTVVAIGSFEELIAKSGRKDLKAENFDPHKPLIDEITWQENGETFTRIPEVLDCWFDSGSMPIASQSRPRPQADYICEAIDQTRGWFYSLLAVSVALQEANESNQIIPPYKNVLCLGHIQDRDGQKMSKSKGNVINPWDLFKQFGADPVRWFMVSVTSAGQSIRFDSAGINEVMRRFVLPLWNTYAFYVLYANLEKVSTDNLYSAPGELLERQLKPIDVWIAARMNETQKLVTHEFENYEFSKATSLIEKFVDDLSNVWVRANRSRFWNTSSTEQPSESSGILPLGSGQMKPAESFSASSSGILPLGSGQMKPAESFSASSSGILPLGIVDYAAYQTLHTCLLAVVRMAAPIIPLISENIYQNLKAKNNPESIHLADWINGDENTDYEKAVLAEMSTAQEIINLGRNLRQELKIKIRQPLSQIKVSKAFKIQYFSELILSELNVKELLVAKDEDKVSLNTNLTQALISEGLAREFIHAIQGLRKSSGLEVDDRIELFVNFSEHNLASASEFPGLLRTQKDYIISEVLALSWREEIQADSSVVLSRKNIKLNGHELEVSIVKATNN
jgi:isoleucyl-tRNA synthetase